MSRSAFIQMCTEFLPTLIFFIAGQLFSFMGAVLALTVSTAIALIISLWQLGRVPFLPLFSALFVIVSGLITLIGDNPQAIILADTIYFTLLASLISAGLWRDKLFLKWIFSGTFAITDRGWQILSFRWLTLLSIAALANEIVRFAASPEFWVDYRFFKIILIIGFALFQFRVSKAHRIPEQSNKWGLRIVTEAELKKPTATHTS